MKITYSDHKYEIAANELFTKKRKSLIPSAEDMKVEHEFMLALCEEEGHHRTGQWKSVGVTTCYCGHNMVLFVKT